MDEAVRLRVCFFGDFDPEYNRTKMLIEGLRLKGVEVLLCHTRERSKKKYVELWRQFRLMKNQCDVVVLGFSDDRWMPLAARVIVGRKKIMWDLWFSYYDNWVFDRKLVKPHSLKALFHWSFDWVNCRLVDGVVLDYVTHINYFRDTFGVNPARCFQVNGTADTCVFYPQPKPTAAAGKFRVEYHGKYIPVQGVEVIVRAAKLLADDPDIVFTMIGDGQEYKKTRAFATELGVGNIEFLPFLPLKELPPYIAAADVCLGLIGDVPRVARTVANKLYEATAMGRVCITADVPAIREIFTDGVDVVLVKQGSVEDLVEKIRYLKANPEITARLSAAAYQTFVRCCSPDVVGTKLTGALAVLLGKRIV